jgi:predicted TIM-barrel fold metal-dependent hydrolase
MVRIALSGIFDTLPNLKLIIHHRGALIPEWSGRIIGILERYEKLGMAGPNISKPYVKHFKKFYCDTAVSGHEPQLLKAAHDFFGADRMVFGTDWPLGDDVANSRASVNASGISREEMKKVYSENILRIIPSGA